MPGVPASEIKDMVAPSIKSFIIFDKFFSH